MLTTTCADCHILTINPLLYHYQFTEIHFDLTSSEENIL